jgi:hypothetical protein
MKRSDDSRLIKIPDANAVAAASGGGGGGPGVGPHSSNQQNSVSMASVFPQRPSIIDMQSQLSVGSNVSSGPLQQQSHHPLQAHRAGVTVYRGEPSGVGGTPLPPAAHTGVVVSATSSSGQPPSGVMHGAPQAVAQQTGGNIKSEPISK